MKMTITEALADIKTSQARILKKRQAVKTYLFRDSRLRDPMESEGGQKEFVRRERQAIYDLEEKIVKIRAAIQKANLNLEVEVDGRKRTLAEWLNWRREISANQKQFLSEMTATLASARQQAIQRGQQVRDSDTSKTDMAVGELIVTISERELAESVEEMENVLGQLDGKLSLLNATTTIEI